MDHVPEPLQVGDGQHVFSIAQRYIDGCATIHLHLRVRPRRDDPCAEELCAVLRGGLGARDDVLDLRYITDGSWPPLKGLERAIFGLDHWHGAPDVEHLMLVRVVQPTELPERVTFRQIGSQLVGLKALHECPIFRAYSAQHPARPLRFVRLPAYADGELRFSGGVGIVDEDELPEEIVERGPQVVTKLGHDQSDTGIGWWSTETEDVLAGIVVEVTDDAAILLREKGATFEIECGQVLVRTSEP